MTVDWDWSRVVFDHVKIGVRDAEASRTFYRTVLATLDIPPLWEGEHGGQYANLVVSANAEPGGVRHQVARRSRCLPPRRSGSRLRRQRRAGRA
jgi:catechol 2,3-dioxygenase-like lactoylglutathione lyase family enzyme